MVQQPKIIKGGTHTDHRGKVSFMNDFDMTEVKRSYVIFHPETGVVRAWRAHKVEQRWFHVLDGGFIIRLVKIDNWEMPDRNLSVEEFTLIAENIQVLHIPNGYGSSIQAIQKNSKLIVFGDYGIENAKLDDYLYPADFFGHKENNS